MAKKRTVRSRLRQVARKVLKGTLPDNLDLYCGLHAAYEMGVRDTMTKLAPLLVTKGGRRKS